MAEGIFNHLAESGSLHAKSAGLAAGSGYPAAQSSQQAAKAYGIDLSRHRSQPVTPELVREAKLILAMTKSQEEEILERYPKSQGKVFTLKEYAGMQGDIVDPIGLDLKVYQKVFDEIRDAVEKVFRKIGATENRSA